MKVYTEVIDAAKTTGARAIRWTPARGHYGSDGELEISDRKKVRTYSVTEFPATGGRGFRCAKADLSDGYNVLIAPNERYHTCDCAAGCYGKVRQCCHVAALVAVIANGWLPDPKCDPRETGAE